MSSSASSDGQRPTHTPIGLIAFAWTLVGVPLVYGLYQTVKTALTLFTG
ncbi:MFS transporter small subunit [Blastococcus sp. SYSU D00820]